MSKRSNPFLGDYERQLKKRLTDHAVNENDPAYINKIYERTNELLFEGARRAAEQPSPLEGMGPSSSIQVEVASFDESCWDMEADDNCDMPMGGGTSETNIIRVLQHPDTPRWPSSKSFPSEGKNYRRELFPILEKEESSCGIDRSLYRSKSENDVSQTHIDQAPIYPLSRSRSRLNLMKTTEKRDPSPIPSAHTLMTSFIHSTRHSHGPLNEDEYNMLYDQAKTYKQLSLDTFLRNKEGTGETSHDQPNDDKDSKDVNDNDAMEY